MNDFLIIELYYNIEEHCKTVGWKPSFGHKTQDT